MNTTTKVPHQQTIVKAVVKPKKKIQRIVQKHRVLKHKPVANMTLTAHSVPIVNVKSTTTTTVPSPVAVNGTQKARHKYKLVKIIKRKRKKSKSKTKIVAVASTHAPSLANVSTTITKLNSTSSRVVVKIKKTSRKPAHSTFSPSKHRETPLGKALSLAVKAASEELSKDGSPSSESRTLTVSRDVVFGNTTNDNGKNINGSKINKEIIECLTRERMAKSGLNLDSQLEIESQRFDMMLQRQLNAARQIRMASRVSGSMMRETYDNEVTDRLAESELKRQDELRRQSKFREQLRDRLDQLRIRFSNITR